MKIKDINVILITILTMSCTARNVHSTVMVKQGIGDLTKRARTIVQGRVRGITQEWSEDKTMIYTLVRVTVENTMKGAAGVREVLVRQPGGEIGDKGIKVSGYPDFAQGEEVILFLEPFEARGPHSGAVRVVGMAQGKFGVGTDKKTGKKLVMPSQEMPTLLTPQGEEASPVTGPVPLDDFLRSIQRELTQRE